ncbi:hypothetical protein EJB05_17428, partial [Eragrostis curvula]
MAVAVDNFVVSPRRKRGPDQPESPRPNPSTQEMEAAGGATPSQPPAPHPAVAPLAFLLGKWRGEGEGSFPTIAPFRYGEELLFSHHPSKPVISYTQRTWKAASGEPMHAESGYWRPRPDGSIEVVIAQSTGLSEVQVSPSRLLVGSSIAGYAHFWGQLESAPLVKLRFICCSTSHLTSRKQLKKMQKGSYDAEKKTVTLQSELVGNASKVKQITRDFQVVNGELSYVVQMETNTTSLQQHLKAILKKN